MAVRGGQRAVAGAGRVLPSLKAGGKFLYEKCSPLSRSEFSSFPLLDVQAARRGSSMTAHSSIFNKAAFSPFHRGSWILPNSKP